MTFLRKCWISNWVDAKHNNDTVVTPFQSFTPGANLPPMWTMPAVSLPPMSTLLVVSNDKDYHWRFRKIYLLCKLLPNKVFSLIQKYTSGGLPLTQHQSHCLKLPLAWLRAGFALSPHTSMCQHNAGLVLVKPSLCYASVFIRLTSSQNLKVLNIINNHTVW